MILHELPRCRPAHRAGATVALAVLCAVSSALAESRPSAALCDREHLAGRSYVECLEKALRDSDRELAETIDRTRTAIDARADLAATQRTRWHNALEEAQGLFLRFRNFECQNVAPYEGRTRIGAFEERLACLIDKNRTRTGELRGRYDAQ